MDIRSAADHLTYGGSSRKPTDNGRYLHAIRLLFALAFLCFGALIIFRAFINPALSKAIFHRESAAAVAFVICLCLTASRLPDHSSPGSSNSWLIGLPALSLLPYLITLRAPLLFDSYTHVVVASTQKFLASITSVYDFRPLGYLDYWLEYRWAGFHSTLWHIDGVLLHIAAVYLFY
jgi:hypothetical protein